ncbi:ERF family protein [Anaerotruncus rubiinfantis]|uniref:ERF family protein n=1 Tax=Anaerotruncus rubiinfantis TaxID=1720200 RepID=UPI000834FCC7|nr:ERF family protein [Anaerotruncus rubiinfantis]
MEGKIYAAMCAAMNSVGAIGKNDRNSQQGFMYRGIDAVYNALQPVLIEHKIFVVPEVLEQTREERQTKSGGSLIYSILKVKFTFYAEDGSNVSAVVIGEGMDSGDKASNKAMSAAFKYACFEAFCIPTDEMRDPDAETPESITPKPRNAPEDDFLKCAECGSKISVSVHDFSVKAYKRPLCMECQKRFKDDRG